MREFVAPEFSAGLPPSERAAACRDMAARLRALSHGALGMKRIVLVCRAVEFDILAAHAEIEQRGSVNGQGAAADSLSTGG
jgi:hypothetical protein